MVPKITIQNKCIPVKPHKLFAEERVVSVYNYRPQTQPPQKTMYDTFDKKPT